MVGNEPIALETAARQRWMAVLARADLASLEEVFEARGGIPQHVLMKPADIGTVMVEGRAGGAGSRFNLGEATVTRCVVRLETSDGAQRLGFSYALGRDKAKARLAAVIDALMQDHSERAALEASLIAPLEARQRAATELASRKAAATKVEFFTLVRGDG